MLGASRGQAPDRNGYLKCGPRSQAGPPSTPVPPVADCVEANPCEAGRTRTGPGAATHARRSRTRRAPFKSLSWPMWRPDTADIVDCSDHRASLPSGYPQLCYDVTRQPPSRPASRQSPAASASIQWHQSQAAKPCASPMPGRMNGQCSQGHTNFARAPLPPRACCRSQSTMPGMPQSAWPGRDGPVTGAAVSAVRTVQPGLTSLLRSGSPSGTTPLPRRHQSPPVTHGHKWHNKGMVKLDSGRFAKL